MKRCNYHTHSTYCDGKNSLRELVEKAIELGCPEIGFSGHGYTDTKDAEPYCMTKEGTEAYRNEIRALQKEYAPKIRILLGLERDYFSEIDGFDYDYVIGSVHYVYRDGVYIPIDESREAQIQAVQEHFDGDYYAFAEDYYRLVGEVADKTQCDIVGHFDLVMKFNENHDLFDPASERYVAASNAALQKLLNRGLIFEINYGAIPRGARKTPYPESRLLNAIRQNGERTLLSSDCHNKDFLLFGIEEDNLLFSPEN